MTTFDEMKYKINKIINEEQNKELEKYEKHKSAVLKINNLGDMLFQLAETFGNTRKQAELQADLIKNTLDSDFIQKSECKIYPNHIVFKKQEFFIQFPTFRGKTIEVGKDKKIKDPRKPEISPVITSYLEIFNEYSKDPSKYEELKEFYYDYVVEKRKRSFIFTFKEKMGFKREQIEASLIAYGHECREELEFYNKNVELYELLISNIKKDEEIFVGSIKEELQMFASWGWSIKSENINKELLEFL